MAHPDQKSTSEHLAIYLNDHLAGSTAAVEMKTSMDDAARGTLTRFELVEALSLGIEGKRALWSALEAGSSSLPALRGIDYRRLIARAEDQRKTAESLRLRLATDAFRAA